MITRELLDSVTRKNGRARRRMARRFARKDSARNVREFVDRAGSVQFTALRLELNRLTIPNYYEKAHARMSYLIDRDVERQARLGVGMFAAFGKAPNAR